jgi:hypothetical protein
MLWRLEQRLHPTLKTNIETNTNPSHTTTVVFTCCWQLALITTFMNHIFYYVNSDNTPFKVEFFYGKYPIDEMLDHILESDWKLIKENEYNSLIDGIKTMTVDIYDKSDNFKIGELTTEWMDLENITIIG